VNEGLVSPSSYIRRDMMRKKIMLKISALIFLLFFVSSQLCFADDTIRNNANIAPEAGNIPDILENANVDINARSAILVDTAKWQTLYAKNANEKLHISTANKIMTTLIVIEKVNLYDKVTISKEASDAEGSILHLEAGEKYSVEDLLYALMLKSANDAANALAEYTAGDVEKFVQMMNAKAQELKLNDTVFNNPTGLYDEKQYTTASDLSVLMKYALSNPTFNNIFSTPIKLWFYSDSSTVLKSQNKLFWSYNGTDGGKLGYNEKDKQSLISTATKNNRRLMAIVLESSEETVYTDAETLLEYGFTNFKSGILVSKGQILKRQQVGDKTINLVSGESVYYTYPIGSDYIKSINIKVVDEITLPVTKSNPLGVATYVLADDTTINVNLYSDTEIYPPQSMKSRFLNTLMENKDILYLIAGLLVLEVLVIIFNIIRAIRRKFVARKQN
jgi:D-alanyl-D-alanine carboxypeptidase/D-alanyl-D-alanine carboxypeptidase (penicillin-binding protein 5/6)